MGSENQHTTIGFIGGGPRAIGIIERLIANVAAFVPDQTLEIFTVDPYPAGPGRIWRYDQSPSLRMNSLAEDVAIFADETCQIAGPLVTGPTLEEWANLVRRGDIAFVPPDDAVAAELDALTPQSFATRRLFSCYLRWYYDHVRSLAPATISIEEITGTVTAVRECGASHELAYVDVAGTTFTRPVDIVIYTVGHTDSELTDAEATILARVADLGLHYWPANYASDANFDSIPGDEALLVRGLGLSFIDIVVRLTLDRGGQQTYDPDAPPGYRSTYIPSGREPRIFAGSRRGVPYHAKITSHLQGLNPGYATTFLTRETLAALLDDSEDVDFFRDVWPIIVREMAFWHYREIFTGHPRRVHGSWEEFAAIFQQEPYGGDRLVSAIRAAVEPEDIFDIDALQRPLAGIRARSLAEVQDDLTAYITRDIHLRESEDHSETLAVFTAVLACYGVIGESLGHPAWSVQSRLNAIPRQWHDFFSYLDSGPPAIRLELLLALMRADILTFVGGEMQMMIDDEQPAFVASSAHQPERVAARYLVDGFHPERTVEHSANPALRDLVANLAGVEHVLAGPDGPVSTRRLEVDFQHGNIIRPDGTSHDRRFAVGDFTSGPPSAAFSRPRTNARIFRENDSIARRLLETATRVPAHQRAASHVH